MKNRIIHNIGILMFAAMLFSGLTAAQEIDTVRIGTYDSRIVAVAYGRSAEFVNYIGELMAEYEEATEAGDTTRVAELTAEGMALQELMHKQVFSIYSVDSILEQIEEELNAIMEENGVESLVNIWENEEITGIEYIDVSDQIAQIFNPDTETLSIIEEIKGVAPIPLEEISDCGNSCSDCNDCNDCGH